MKYSKSLLTVLAVSLAALAGCAGYNAPGTASGVALRADHSVRYEALFVVPNCQPMEGKTYCQWMEPRGYQRSVPAPAPAASTTQRVPGIAL